MKMTSFAKLGALAFALITSGCDQTNTPGSPDASGTANGCDIPCIEGLFADCALSGSCTIQGGNVCYGSGTKLITTIDPATQSSTGTVYRPNGQVCWSTVGTPQSGSDSTTTAFKNASGATVATLMTDTATLKQTVTCTASGRTYDFSQCQLPGTGVTGCVQGVCM